MIRPDPMENQRQIQMSRPALLAVSKETDMAFELLGGGACVEGCSCFSCFGSTLEPVPSDTSTAYHR